MALIKTLYRGLDPATLTIADAFQFYMQNKAKPYPDARYRQEVRFKRHLKVLEDCFDTNKAVASLNRQDARKVRDRLLNKNVTAQKKVSIATVDRYLSDMKAVFAFAALEHDIPYTNPFKGLLDLSKSETGDADLRDSLPDEVMRAVEADLSERKDQILFQLYTVLKFTGARLGEITGLLVGETHLEAGTPYIEIRRRPGRSLKNAWSQRDIPLTKSAVGAVKARLEVVQNDEHLFAKFAGKNGETLASARLMKAIRKQTTDSKHVAHSLRHNFRDRVRANHIPFELGKALEGRRYSSGEEARYGGGFTIEALYEAISKVNGET
jgi:integrase